MSRCDRDAARRTMTSHQNRLGRVNIMRRTTFITALIACLALAVAIAPAASAKGGGTTRTISLKGSVSFPNAIGQAVSKVNGTERELEVDVQHIRSLAGKRVNVNVNGHLFATPRVNSLGHFTVNHNTGAGQAVPTIKAGSTVRVRTLGGTLIAGGTF
jgi:ABC-type phosphate transport system substrate-binding protein